MLTVVTSFSRKGFKQYGKNFVETFQKYWDASIRLLVYVDGFLPEEKEEIQRGEVHDLYDEAKWLVDFLERNVTNTFAHGRGGGGSFARKTGYRYDCAKFAHKVAAILAADKVSTTRYLCWLDGDTITHSPVAWDSLTEVLPSPAWLSWLQRDSGPPRAPGGHNLDYPECGFLLFDCWHPKHAANFLFMERWYSTDEVLTFDETHDSFVWQQLVKKTNTEVRNVSGDGHRCAHVFVNSPLAQWFDHLKGNARKMRGRTLKHERLIKTEHPYWK